MDNELEKILNDPALTYKVFMDSTIPPWFGTPQEREILFLSLFGGISRKLGNGLTEGGGISILLMDASVKKNMLIRHLNIYHPNCILYDDMHNSEHENEDETRHPRRRRKNMAHIVCASEKNKLIILNNVIGIRNLLSIGKYIEISNHRECTGSDCSFIVLMESDVLDCEFDLVFHHINEIHVLSRIESKFDAMIWDPDVIRSRYRELIKNDKIMLTERKKEDVAVPQEIIPHEEEEYDIVDCEIIRKYIEYATSNIFPTIDSDMYTEMVFAVSDILSKSLNFTGADFETLIRRVAKFAEARARAHFRSEVAQEDIDTALSLVEYCMSKYDEVIQIKQNINIDREIYIVITPRYSLDDVVLTPYTREQVNMALTELRYEKHILEKWGFGSTIKGRRGVKLLFTGQPGTGKTMTAEAIANAVGKKIMLVNYPRLESCWVGDTEKNIQNLFRKAEKENAVLLFDEADAVFYKRSGDERSWSNRWVNVLLSCLDAYEGIVILTTNLSCNMDGALERRVDLIVDFEFPNADMRERIYRHLIPKNAPISDDVDIRKLAVKYKVAGGGILNIVRSATRYAIQNRGPDGKITMADFEHAARLECEKSRAMATNYLACVKGQETVRPDGYA